MDTKLKSDDRTLDSHVRKQLEAEGWTRQFVADEPRLSEAVRAYQEAGFEVHLEPLPEKPARQDGPGKENGDECRTCFEGFEDRYKIIYTRPKGGGSTPEELGTKVND